MRDLVNSSWFLFRKKVDNLLHTMLPSKFIPLYTMVTFSQIPYATVIEKNTRQRKLVNAVLFFGAGAALAGAFYATRRALLS